MEPMLSLQVEAEWREVRRVRERSEDFLRAQGLGTEAIDALTMVACELTENAVKYGHFGADAEKIRVTMTIGRTEVVVEVRSPVTPAESEAVAKLDYAIQWIRGHQDPFEAYLERLKDASAHHMTSTESGLGLVRIAYEGHSILDFYIDDQNMLAVSAVYPLNAGSGASS